MAISKTSAKSESWTLRVPKDLAIAVREKFPAEAGVTEIVIRSLKAYLGIDDSDFNKMSNSVLQSDLQEIVHRLETLEQEILELKSGAKAESIPLTADKDDDSEWTNTKVIASRLKLMVGIIVEPKSISGAFSKRGKDLGGGIFEVDMKDGAKRVRANIQRRKNGTEFEYRITVT